MARRRRQVRPTPRPRRTGPAPGLLVLGTSSDAGKSFVATGLCRLLRRRGWPVHPFKAANMSLNSTVASEGGEMAVAQWVQCQAAGVAATTLANPILYKSTGPGRVEVIVRGRVAHQVRNWRRQMGPLQPKLRAEVRRALWELHRQGWFLVAEGAGSPAEVNLRRTDLSNLDVARELDLPAILVTDLERGGALAHVVGTLDLLSPPERRRIRGLVLNRMRGDPALLQGAVEFLQRRTGVPVLGILPYLEPNVASLPPEDSLALDHPTSPTRPDAPRLAIVRFPHVANFGDIDRLTREPGLRAAWVRLPREAEGWEGFLLPGSRRVRDDLAWLEDAGWAAALHRERRRGARIIGICGGYQMLGRKLEDPHGFEGPAGERKGLGWLPVRTRYEDPKVTRRGRARPTADHPALPAPGDYPVYEVRRGRTERARGAPAIFHWTDVAGRLSDTDGARSRDGRIWGSALHGIFDAPQVRAALVPWLSGPGTRARRGRGGTHPPATLEHDLDAVADLLEQNLDLERLGVLLGRRI